MTSKITPHKAERLAILLEELTEVLMEHIDEVEGLLADINQVRKASANATTNDNDNSDTNWN